MSAAAVIAARASRLSLREGKPEAVRRERRDVEEPVEPPERDLLDSPSDSWRDLELRAMLDEIGAA